MQRFFVFGLLFLSVLLASAYQLLTNPDWFQNQDQAQASPQVLSATTSPQMGASVTSPNPTTVWTFEEPFDVPRHVLENYYDSLVKQQHKFAYSLWAQEGAASGFDFESFQQRFQNLKSARVVFLSQGEMGEAEGFRYFKQPVTVETEDNKGQKKTFQAEYTLRQPSSAKVSETWHIYNVTYQQTP